ncbi:MAG: hypothetical protein H7A46_23290 [Verrucomicrobiales bacterium]|nr:hypothetical protein [Verrucomicrobiales bacterium]
MSEEPEQRQRPSVRKRIVGVSILGCTVLWIIHELVLEGLPYFAADPKRWLTLALCVVVGAPFFVAYARLPEKWQRGIEMGFWGGFGILWIIGGFMAGWILLELYGMTHRDGMWLWVAIGTTVYLLGAATLGFLLWELWRRD